MPRRAPTPCRQTGCAKLVATSGYCPDHQPVDTARRGQLARWSRPEETRLYHTARWVRERRLYLQLNPLCVECMREGSLMGATQVDHIEPHHGDVRKFFDLDNWQGLCIHCHSRKTARERRAQLAATGVAGQNPLPPSQSRRGLP